VDYFKSTLTKKGRSKLIEDPIATVTEARDALIILTSVEKHDEPNPQAVAKKGVEEVALLSHRLKVKTLVLHPFTHLFGQLSTPKVAITTLQLMKEELEQRGFNVTRTPFGWFNALEIKAKGHPLSRIARHVELAR
jgi:threonyl-tRNA synthetase